MGKNGALSGCSRSRRKLLRCTNTKARDHLGPGRFVSKKTELVEFGSQAVTGPDRVQQAQLGLPERAR
ncbi:hypothetical protein AUC45_07900 [Erythrobacter sp. YT30]|nr:hypothetical protein AUC45_07900 [Erythrobacter sp. YT30]